VYNSIPKSINSAAGKSCFYDILIGFGFNIIKEKSIHLSSLVSDFELLTNIVISLAKLIGNGSIFSGFPKNFIDLLACFIYWDGK